MTASILARAFSAERIKLRRTLALWLALIAPLITVLLRAIEWSQRGEIFLFPGVNPWERLAQSVIVIWCMLMLPLFVVLETALLAGLEHNENQWKHLFALPIPRWSIYAMKLFIGLLLVGVSSIMLVFGIIITGFMLSNLEPSLGFGSNTIPLSSMLLQVVFVFFASWLILAIHTWVGIRWRSFTGAIGIGIALIFFGLIISSTTLGWVYPWSLPVNIVFGEGERVPIALIIGVVGGLVVAGLGGWNIAQRDVL